MNTVNMGGMNALGGPVGGSGMPMMNNVAPGGGPRQQMPENPRTQLNTYIYDYFLRNGMFDCARTLYQNDATMKVIKESPGRMNGADDGDDAESKDEIDKQRPDDLPRADIPKDSESCFLLEWWSIFWDMFNAQRGKGNSQNVIQYVNHTQAQSRIRQEHQQHMLRNLRNGGGAENMMPQGYNIMRLQQNQQAANGMALNPNELRHKAINNNRNLTPQQQQMQKQQQMQRDPSGSDQQQRSGSPGSAENAPSPSKRPRLDSAGFNPQQLPNGRGQPMPQQFPNMPNGANAQQQQQQQQQQLGAYQARLAQQQASQMPNKGMPNASGPPNAGSPMMTQGQDGGAIAGYYNAGEMAPNGNMRPVVAGQPPTGGGGGNHALQDYQMQLMLLEQQNKKRLMMARQEQDNMAMPGQGREGGPGMGPNGQNFQGTSPQGPRSVNSPNPSEQMKRTPHMNAAGIPSPLPEGQARDSPNNMNFIPGQMDPNMNPQYFVKNGMDPNMAVPNGMRPPSSHPPGFSVQGMTPNQMAIARSGNWQGGPNGQMMPAQGGPQQPMPQGQGTPQQRPMPPPAAPGTVPNGRTQPPSPQQNANAPPTPQQGNKPIPKKNKNDAKDAKTKRVKKGGAPATGATPSDSAQEPATPTPATPITPIHTKTFTGPNGAVQPTNGQAPGQLNTGMVGLQPEPLQNFGMDNNFDIGNFAFNENTGNNDVLQDFDFDSFLHQDGENEFNFDTAGIFDADQQILAEQ